MDPELNTTAKVQSRAITLFILDSINSFNVIKSMLSFWGSGGNDIKFLTHDESVKN